jgi:ribosomal protein L15E
MFFEYFFDKVRMQVDKLTRTAAGSWARFIKVNRIRRRFRQNPARKGIGHKKRGLTACGRNPPRFPLQIPPKLGSI